MELLQFVLGAASSMGDAVAPEILAASAELASATVGKPAGARADGTVAGAGVEKAGIAATGVTWPRFSLCRERVPVPFRSPNSGRRPAGSLSFPFRSRSVPLSPALSRSVGRASYLHPPIPRSLARSGMRIVSSTPPPPHRLPLFIPPPHRSSPWRGCTQKSCLGVISG